MLVVTKRDQPVADAVPPDEPANLIGTNYSFWPSARFWDTDGVEYTTPVELDERGEHAHSARTPLAELHLRKGSSLAYLFDYGDEGHLFLEVVDTWRADDESCYPMLVEAEGIPPPQYAAVDDQ